MVKMPEATKCCFCVPLRRGLLAWVYIKLAILSSLTLIVVLPLSIFIFHNLSYVDDILIALLILGYALLATEIVFEIIFIVSAHNKKYKYLKIYYRYEIVMLSIEIVMSVIYVSYTFIEWAGETYLIGPMVGGLLISLTLLALHIYFIYLLRSEVRKLELSTQFTFKNLANDPECSAQILDPN